MLDKYCLEINLKATFFFKMILRKRHTVRLKSYVSMKNGQRGNKQVISFIPFDENAITE